MMQAVSGLTPRGRHWLAMIQNWERSGLAMREFCARQGVKPGTLSWWRRELKRLARQERGDGRVELVEITRDGTRAETGFEVALANGLRVRVPMRFDAAALQQLLGVLTAC